jgi:Zn-dependent protease with chaperone function
LTLVASAAAPLVALLAAAPVGDPAAGVRLDGYAEWREGDFLIVDGQKVRMAPDGKVEGEGQAHRFADVPLGYEVKVEGRRLPDGTVAARRLEARPNAVALFENMIQEATDEAEARYRKFGQFFVESGGKMKTIGRLESDGPRAERVRAIVASLLPPYVDPARVRVYVIENKEWNAFAMGNYAIYVFSGLLDDMDDDSLAIVLGHELAHATHEHTRRQLKREMWIQLATAGATAAASEIDSKGKRTVAQAVTALSAAAWSNGYGRNLEDQADRVGLRYAYEAGYDVTKGPALWDRFARKYGSGNAVTTFFFSDHSRSTARATNLRQQLAFNYADAPRPAANASRRTVPPAPAVPAPADAAPSVAAARALASVVSTPADRPPTPTPRHEIKTGMSMDDVRAVLGPPADELAFERRTRWTFPDCAVIFEDGKVVEVRF